MKKHPLSDAIVATVAARCPALLDDFVQEVFEEFHDPKKHHPALYGRLMREIRHLIASPKTDHIVRVTSLSSIVDGEEREYSVVRAAPKNLSGRTTIIHLPLEL